MSDCSEHRCLSSAGIETDDLRKRCIRALGHPEQHLWVEAVRSDGSFTVARWQTGDRLATCVTVRSGGS